MHPRLLWRKPVKDITKIFSKNKTWSKSHILYKKKPPFYVAVFIWFLVPVQQVLPVASSFLAPCSTQLYIQRSVFLTIRLLLAILIQLYNIRQGEKSAQLPQNSQSSPLLLKVHAHRKNLFPSTQEKIIIIIKRPESSGSIGTLNPEVTDLWEFSDNRSV